MGAGLLAGCATSGVEPDGGEGSGEAPPAAAPAAELEAAPATFLDAGSLRFRWDGDWPELPQGFELGNTHGAIAFALDGRGFVSSDVHGILVVGADGVLQEIWGGPLIGGVHGLSVQENSGEGCLWATHTARHEVLKLDLDDGRLLATFGCPLEAAAADGSAIYADATGYRPTAVTTDPAGHVWVADGYGASWLHEFEASGEYLRSIGGPGKAEGRFQTCHGLLYDDRPEAGVPAIGRPGSAGAGLIVADRENGRLQRFGLDGRHLGTLEGVFRRPCSVARFGNVYAVADLAGRVTLVDQDQGQAFQLGENPDPAKWADHGVPPERWEVGAFTSPHSAVWDAEGNLYVMDWVAAGRITRLARVAE
jgi:hypothetical protein